MISIVSAMAVLAGLAYFAFTTVGGWISIRRERVLAAETEEDLASSPPVFRVVGLLAALNESTVIAETVSAGFDSGAAAMVVVDDASTDDTAALARAAAADAGRGGDLVIVSRVLPEAQLGKGPALNAGFAALAKLVAQRGWDPASVIVCVLDADGRLSPGALDEVLGLFDDPRVGGAQLPVRIRNRSRILTRVQDCEFWGLAAVGQFARSSIGSVSLGGNGQFTRFAALQPLGEPWSSSLTEDLDLSITLAAAGWRLRSTSRAWVDQEGVETIRALVTQRTRWFQGHLASTRRLPELAASPHVSAMAYQELAVYMLSPLLLMIPWSILFTMSFWGTVQFITSGRAPVIADSAAVTWGLAVFIWYAASFLPIVVAGVMYWRRAGDISLVRSIAIAHLGFLLQPVYWWCAWHAVSRIVRGRAEWAKTPRLAKPEPAPVSLLAPVPRLAPAGFGSGARCVRWHGRRLTGTRYATARRCDHRRHLPHLPAHSPVPCRDSRGSKMCRSPPVLMSEWSNCA